MYVFLNVSSFFQVARQARYPVYTQKTKITQNQLHFHFYYCIDLTLLIHKIGMNGCFIYIKYTFDLTLILYMFAIWIASVSMLRPPTERFSSPLRFGGLGTDRSQTNDDTDELSSLLDSLAQLLMAPSSRP